MGKGKKRVWKRDFKTPRENVWQPGKRSRNDFTTAEDMSNDAFADYYRAQKICPEGEFDDFLAVLATPLPITFRINGSGRFAEDFRSKLESDFLKGFSSGPIRFGDEIVQPPKVLPWYPNRMAWQLNFSRHQLRRLPVLEEIHEFIKRENEGGTITRQEAVSMVPPLFLDVQSHHRVLDMCAAPGSKTFQLLEALHAGVQQGAPSGLVVANDSEAQRCNLLTHQTKRICSPCLIVTNHEGQRFPIVRPAGTPESEGVMYDRILADVPCSGDGTLRKAPDIWKRWTASNGNFLHSVQLRIAVQGCHLLKMGGRMVYSTCSFNPIEDEAVVAALLKLSKGAMQLLDVSHVLPELKREPGLRTWRVYDKNQSYATWEEALEKRGDRFQKGNYRIDPTMFCDEETAQLPLQHCMRVLPHHQDTGGFFIAVLEKVGDTTHMQVPNVEVQRRRDQSKEGRDTSQQAADDVNKYAGDGPKPVPPELLEQMQAEIAAEMAADADAGMRYDASQQRDNGDEDDGDEVTSAKHAVDGIGSPDNVVYRPAKRVATEEAVTGNSKDASADGLAADGTAASDTVAVAADGSVAEATADGSADAKADEGTAAAEGGKKVEWGIRGGGSRGREGGGKWRHIDPIIPVRDEALLNSIRTFYGFADDFELLDSLIVRSTDTTRPKRLYFVSNSVKEVLLMDNQEQLKVTSTGLKLLERQEPKGSTAPHCLYRISQEGLAFILPFIKKRRIYLSAEEFYKLLTVRNVGVPRAQDAKPDQPPADNAAAAAAQPSTAAAAARNATANGATANTAEAQPAAAADATTAGAAEPAAQDATAASTAAATAATTAANGDDKPDKVVTYWIADEETKAVLADMMMGCVVATLRDDEARRLGLPTSSDCTGALTANAPLAASCWRGRVHVSLQVAKVEAAQMAEKLKAAMDKHAASEKQESKPDA